MRIWPRSARGGISSGHDGRFALARSPFGRGAGYRSGPSERITGRVSARTLSGGLAAAAERRVSVVRAFADKDLALAASAPNDADNDDEPVYPGTCRERKDTAEFTEPAGVNWRFRVPDGEEIELWIRTWARKSYVAGKDFDFGDFLVWRRDDVPAYQLAAVVDDAAMRITEVVRGADLLKSTARQLLLLRALGYADLGYAAPDYFHCELVRDAAGVRLAKRHDALSIRYLRESGMAPEKVLEMAGCP